MRPRDYAAEYRRRVDPERLRHLGLTRRQARGHPGAAEAHSSRAFSAPFFAQTPEGARLIEVRVGPGEQRRAGKYMGQVRLLLEGKLGDAAFVRRVRDLKPISGFDLVKDPSTVRALARQHTATALDFGYPEGASR